LNQAQTPEESKEIPVNKKLYVGNLPYSITESALRELFAQAGEVSTVSIHHRPRYRRAKGFAFVEMATDEAAVNAIKQINGKTLDERNITVAEARPQAPRGDFGGGRGGYGGGNRGGFGGRGGRGGGAGGGRRRG